MEDRQEGEGREGEQREDSNPAALGTGRVPDSRWDPVDQRVPPSSHGPTLGRTVLAAIV